MSTHRPDPTGKINSAKQSLNRANQPAPVDYYSSQLCIQLLDSDIQMLTDKYIQENCDGTVETTYMWPINLQIVLSKIRPPPKEQPVIL